MTIKQIRPTRCKRIGRVNERLSAMSSLSDATPAASGAALRDEALSLLAATRPATIRKLQRAAVSLALEAGTVTADDVRDAVPIAPNINPKVMGSAIRQLAVLNILRGGDYVRSRRRVAHCRPVRQWHLADAGRAVCWLAAHPEPTDSTIA